MFRRSAVPSRVTLASEAATRRLGEALAPLLAPGDTVALWGDLGAGKSFLARAIIQTRLCMAGTMEDVPSPTFTLVQTYLAGDVEIWHADLYRLMGPDDVDELGLQDAFDTAVCLIEWPDRMEADLPSRTLHLHLAAGAGADDRVLTLDWQDAAWARRLAPILTTRSAANG